MFEADMAAEVGIVAYGSPEDFGFGTLCIIGVSMSFVEKLLGSARPKSH